MSLRFDNKVVVITGAGGGLGRDYALDFAKRGAKVVVNDLANAEKVVNEIKALGGIAVADGHNVIDGEKIIETAVKNFGTVHVLINNAGILRDVSFAKMSEQQFSLVLQVHLYGAYHCSKAAWPYFRKQNYGRIVNAASPAGLYGNFGQANYSAAKSALVGFAETLAKEGKKYNILANCIAPTARSQMTEGIIDEKVLSKMGPEYVTPMVVYLSHESTSSETSGKIFELAGGVFCETRWERSAGELFYPDESLTAEAILNKLKDIEDFSHDKSFKKIEHPTQIPDYHDLVHKAMKLNKPNPQGNVKVSLKDRVVIITGAGAGLGRAHAHFFAKYGAKVVVNDISDPSPVVKEIESAGGEAFGVQYNAATDASKIVDAVLKKYGRIDALVNNAGILRDKSFAKMSFKEWDDVMQVHVMSTFRLCKAVWPVFLKQKHGRIVNITSTSGIYGNFGQANYASAKMAILGFSRSLAIEGKSKNIMVNIVAPHAETAMTKTIFKKEDFNLYPPELVSPLLVLLSWDNVPVTGKLYECGGGWVGNVRLEISNGAVLTPKDKNGAEFVAQNWSKVTDFSKSEHLSSLPDVVRYFIGKFPTNAEEDDDEDDDDDDDDDDDSEAQKVDDKGNPIFTYTDRDTILYNIGVGAKSNELQYVYENSSDFQLIPSFAAVVAQNIKKPKTEFQQLVKNFSPVLLLHGEQYIKINKWPVPTSASLATEDFPVEVLDKGKAAITTIGFNSYDVNTKEPVFYTEMTCFLRGAKAPGNKRFVKREPFSITPTPAPKDVKPDFSKIVTIDKDQAAIYRLSGDYNPLHIDPAFARNAKFDRPILHGLGYLGVSVKQLLEKYGPIKEIKNRFSGSVYPGDTLRVDAWKKGDIVVFQTYNLSTNTIVISNAAIKLFGKEKL